MHKIVLGTRNPGKIVEFRRILAESGLAIELVGTDGFPDLGDIPETGLTFAENALLKARAVSAHTGLPAVADDSGLCVDVLGGMPGIFSARWSGRRGDDAANLRLLLAQMADVPGERRMAHFVCAAALVMPGDSEDVVEGRLDGTLIREPRGAGGFGYDPIFVPLGETRTTAEQSPAEKDAISHRGRALRALTPIIAKRVAWERTNDHP
jgi:XTP/dITP diphosphohydrolase